MLLFMKIKNNLAINFYHFFIFYLFQYNFTALGHSMDTMLLQCSYQGDQCFSSNFTGYDDPIYGRCYAFVVDNSYSTYSGPNYGLSLILNVESEEYLELLSPSLGFQACCCNMKC
jgi:hypothetical protein